MLLQKRVVSIKLDIYDFIISTGSIPYRYWHGLLNICIIEIGSS
jgi:hypothetical protein